MFSFFIQHVYKVHICKSYVDVICSFSLFYNIPLYEYIVLMHSTVTGHLSCFQFGVITNNAAVTFLYTSFCLFVHTCMHFWWGIIYLGGEWLDHKICIYSMEAVNVSFSKLHQFILSQSSVYQIPTIPHASQHLLFLVFKILYQKYWYLSMVLICIAPF